MDFGSSGSSQQSQQGFRDLPPEIQNAFKSLATQAQSFLPGSAGSTPMAGGGVPASTMPVGAPTAPVPINGKSTYPHAGPADPVAAGPVGATTIPPTSYSTGNGSDMFRPMGQTAGETQAIGNINRGFTPNASQYQSDIAMQMNPFDSSVIDTINRQGQGANSVLQQSLNSAGQFGSNRAFLGANDIDLSRLNQIGTFKQNQFNTASDNALKVLPGQRLNDATAQLGAGTFQRNLDTQQRQAPISALQSIAQILGILPTNSGQSSGQSSAFSFGFK